MFKCKECGCEYEIKPDFCDCGNDEFIVENSEQDVIVEKKVEKPKPATSIQTQNVDKPIDKKTNHSPLKSSFDAVSATIFTVCIVLSFYVVFFAWNPKENNTEQQETTNVTVTNNIPSIEKFWNNSLPKVVTPKEESPAAKPVETVVTSSKTVQNLKVQQVSQPKKTQTTVQKQTTKPKTTTVKSNKNTATEQAKAQEKAKQEAELKVKQEVEQKAKQEAELKAKQQAALKAKQDAEAKAKQAEKDKQELAQYKAKLRNTLGYKIDFTKVVGDGDCIVAFKINQSGQLINRSFAKQSSNITLNDAVYNAIMSTPKFNPPPAGYNNETLNLSIKFYNGNFEISLR